MSIKKILATAFAGLTLLLLEKSSPVQSFMIRSQTEGSITPQRTMKRQSTQRYAPQPPVYRVPPSQNQYGLPCRLPGCCPPVSSSLYCSAISPDSDSDSDVSSSDGLKTKESWKEKLLNFSNFASFLCVLDCTILPIITVLLPFFGIVAASPAQMEWLHGLGHKVALYFVMPVGLTATSTNYLLNHRKFWITAIGWVGLAMILVANAGCSLVGHHHPAHHFLHQLAHGVMHRVTNLAGCGLLILSNLISRRQHTHGPNCSHQHHD